MTNAIAAVPSTRAESEGAVAPLTGIDARNLIHTTEWLWANWIPRGHVTIVTGEGGIGKSWFALALARAAADGSPWPDGAAGTDPTGPVFWFEPEAFLGSLLDRAERVGLALDRLVLMPDLTRTYYLDRPDDLACVRGVVESAAPSLIVVDSWSRALESTAKAHSLRTALRGLQDLAQSADAALALLHHLPRRRHDTQTYLFDFDRLRGSEMLAQAAATWIGINQPEYASPVRRVSCGKTTFGCPPEPLAFHITDAGPDFTENPCQRPQTRLEEAIHFLECFLADGPQTVSNVTHYAKLEGIALETLRTAKRQVCDYHREWSTGRTHSQWSLKRRTDNAAHT